MAKAPVPTIKGVFVNSHIKLVRKVKGEEGVNLLERRFGKPLKYTYLQEVPVHDEIKIIELSLDILSDSKIPVKDRAFEAGRLHFRNFSGTPLGKLILRALPDDPKALMMKIPRVASHVFRYVKFTSIDLGNNTVEIIMENNDYPIDHFKGLFYEWMIFMNYQGSVEANELKKGIYAYTVNWK